MPLHGSLPGVITFGKFRTLQLRFLTTLPHYARDQIILKKKKKMIKNTILIVIAEC